MIKQRGNRTKIAVRVLALVLVCILIPTTLISIQWLENSRSLLMNQLIDNTNAKLIQADNALTLLQENISLLYQMLLITDEFKLYSTYSDGAYIEHECAPYASIARTSDYVKAKSCLRNLLKQYINNYDIINSIYYYDVAKNVVISYRWIDYNIQSFFDLSWLEQINIKRTTYLPSRKIYPTRNEIYDVFSIVYMPMLKGNTVYIVFNLDSQILCANYLMNEQTDSNDILILWGNDGQPLLGIQGNTLLPTADLSEITQPYCQDNNLTGNYARYQGNMLVANRVISRLGWNVTLLRNTDTLQKRIFHSGLVVIAIMVSSLLIITGAMAIILFQLLSPTSSLLGKESRKANKTPLLLRGTEMENLGQLMQESRAAMRFHYWNWVILGRVPDGKEGWMQYTPNVSACFLLARIDVFDVEGISGTHSMKDNATLQQALKDAFQATGIETVPLSESSLLIALSCRKEEFNQTSGRLADCYRQADSCVESASILAIGGYCDTLKDVRECWAKASILLRYQQMTGSTQILYDRQVENAIGSAEPKMWEMNKQLAANLKQEAYKEAQLTLENLLQMLHDNALQMDYLQIKHRSIYTLSMLVECWQKHSASNPQVQKLPQDLYARVLNMTNINDIWQICFDMLANLEALSSGKEYKVENSYVENILELLKTDCGYSMNLSAVAEKMELSAVYLSKIFKNTTGINYTQYLTQCRMEKAKILLQDPDMLIQDVADTLGYSQSHYFSKIFKQYTGLTPSEYISSLKK